MKFYNCPQLTDEWWNLHKGKPSASNFAKIMTPARRQYSKQAKTYAYELIAQLGDPNPPWLSNQGRPIHTTSIQNGIDLEPEARLWYAMQTDQDVRQVGLCMTDDERFICSPDGLVGDDGGLELKSPLLATHLEYLDEGVVPLDYLPQVHGSLIVTGRKWWDFVSYAIGIQPLIVRVYPDEFTEALRQAMEQFWREYSALRERLLRREESFR